MKNSFCQQKKRKEHACCFFLKQTVNNNFISKNVPCGKTKQTHLNLLQTNYVQYNLIEIWSIHCDSPIVDNYYQTEMRTFRIHRNGVLKVDFIILPFVFIVYFYFIYSGKRFNDFFMREWSERVGRNRVEARDEMQTKKL